MFQGLSLLEGTLNTPLLIRQVLLRSAVSMSISLRAISRGSEKKEMNNLDTRSPVAGLPFGILHLRNSAKLVSGDRHLGYHK